MLSQLNINASKYIVTSLKNNSICPDNTEDYNGNKVLGSAN